MASPHQRDAGKPNAVAFCRIPDHRRSGGTRRRTSPTASGVSGKLTVVNDAHGGQLAYNGHLLRTFISDRPGQVTGQGVQNFFVVTPGIAQIAGTPAPTGSVPASPAGL